MSSALISGDRAQHTKGSPCRLRIAAKLNALTIFLIVATAVAICFFMIRLEMQNYTRDLLNHGKALAATTEKNCEYGIRTRNGSLVAPILDSLATDADIAYAAVLDADHAIVAGRVFGGSGILAENAGRLIGREGPTTIREFTDSRTGRQYLEILYAVSVSGRATAPGLRSGSNRAGAGPPIIGYLRLGLSREGLQQRLRRLVGSIVAATGIIVLSGIAATLVLTRRITSPLKRLTAAMQDAAEGRFDSPIDVRAGDEIADLARSFEHMRGRLSSYRIDAEERAAELTMMNDLLVQEIDARRNAEQQLQHDALHDTLTGLPNRILLAERLGHVIRIGKRRPDFLYAVLCLDVDRFKIINDSLGHGIGDQLLVSLGRRLTSCLRPGDTVARLGGDEFAMLLEDISGISNAVFVAERIGRVMAEPFRLLGEHGEHEVFVTGSIGISMGSDKYERPDQLLRDADTAMYKAKTDGKAHAVVFEPGMHAVAVKRLQLETDLRRAIERRELVPYYQPIVSLPTHRLAGFEALVRWRHPARGMVAPGDFLPMAEETGMIVSIDRLMLQESCRQMQQWTRAMNGNNVDFVSVNLSNKQMLQPDLADHVDGLLRDTGLDPGRLKLEITENVVLDNPEKAIHTLSRLKALGVKLFIDDFGTGYSSLSYLHRLPIDGLKIDRSFIKAMGQNGENQEIIRTIVLLARDRNIEVIAEGLETPEQAARIHALKCDYGQGYLFSKPVDEPSASMLIEQGRLGFPSAA